jgi:hypothetical protein
MGKDRVAKRKMSLAETGKEITNVVEADRGYWCDACTAIELAPSHDPLRS